MFGCVPLRSDTPGCVRISVAGENGDSPFDDDDDDADNDDDDDIDDTEKFSAARKSLKN